jgi:flagellar motor protein MotB
MKIFKLSIMAALALSLIGFTFFNNLKTQALDEKTQFLDFGKSISGTVEEEKLARLKNTSKLDRNEFESLKSYYKTFSPELTDEQIKEKALNDVIAETAIISQAAQLNLLPSEAEVLKRVEEERKKFENSSGEENEKVKEMVDSLIKGLGISEDEYWSTVVPNGYVYTISEERLFENETKDISDIKEKEQKWKISKQKFVEDFKTKQKQAIEQFKAKNNN